MTSKKSSKEYSKHYYQLNKDRLKAASKLYNKEHHDKVLEYQKKYRETHREKQKAYSKQYRKEHPEKIAEQRRRFYEKRPEAYAEYKQRYYERHGVAPFTKGWVTDTISQLRKLPHDHKCFIRLYYAKDHKSKVRREWCYRNSRIPSRSYIVTSKESAMAIRDIFNPDKFASPVLFKRASLLAIPKLYQAIIADPLATKSPHSSRKLTWKRNYSEAQGILKVLDIGYIRFDDVWIVSDEAHPVLTIAEQESILKKARRNMYPYFFRSWINTPGTKRDGIFIKADGSPNTVEAILDNGDICTLLEESESKEE